MLSRILETDHFALVVHEQIQCKWGWGALRAWPLRPGPRPGCRVPVGPRGPGASRASGVSGDDLQPSSALGTVLRGTPLWVPTRLRVVIRIGSALEPAPHPAEGRLGAWVAKPNPSPVLGSTARDQALAGVVGGPAGMYARCPGFQTPKLGWEGSPSPHIYSYMNTPQNKSQFQGP